MEDYTKLLVNSSLIPLISFVIWALKFMIERLVKKSIEAFDLIIKANQELVNTNSKLVEVTKKEIKEIKKEIKKIKGDD